ncbi:MAG: amino acid adenylation domain protein, partial [Gammaproteobacteria bacterium]|nr:amino acid adenylation domain protein [Gammaproteobacteria bacterium]
MTSENVTPGLIELNQQQIDRIAATVPGGADNVQDIYPLIPLQQGLLFHHLMDDRSGTYVLSTCLECESRPQLDRLIDAIRF